MSDEVLAALRGEGVEEVLHGVVEVRPAFTTETRLTEDLPVDEK